MTLMLNETTSIELLDCTLRDGAHVNNGDFAESLITEHLSSINESRIEICEVGFWEKPHGRGPVYIDEAGKLQNFREKLGGTKSSIMIRTDRLDGVNPSLAGQADIIRIALYEHHLIDVEKLLTEHSWPDKTRFFLNPINITHCNQNFILNVLELANKLEQISGVCIVDTFGALDIFKAMQWYKLFNDGLLINKKIGIHLHENLGMSMGIIDSIIQFAAHQKNSRPLVLDGSALGMGRKPGNIELEKLMMFLNAKYNKDYNINPILDLIQNYYYPLRNQLRWGYSPEYALSASLNLHRNYPEFLLDDEGLGLRKSYEIMLRIAQEKHDGMFNKDLI